MFHDAGSASALVTALQGDASPIVRKRAAWALGEIHANTAVAGPALQNAAANDASPFVRSLAAAALTRLSSR
jgi:HEAT repeat protein